MLHAMHEGGHVLFGFTALLILGLVLFRLKAPAMTAGALKLFRFLPERHNRVYKAPRLSPRIPAKLGASNH